MKIIYEYINQILFFFHSITYQKLNHNYFRTLVLANDKVGTLYRRFLVNIGWFLFGILTWNKNRFDDNMSSDGWFAVSFNNYLEQKHGELWYKINELDDVKADVVFFDREF